PLTSSTLFPYTTLFRSTSVGAINAGYLASHAEKPGLAIDGLIDAWRSLRVTEHLRINLRGLIGAWSSAKTISAEGPLSQRPVPRSEEHTSELQSPDHLV